MLCSSVQTVPRSMCKRTAQVFLLSDHWPLIIGLTNKLGLSQPEGGMQHSKGSWLFTIMHPGGKKSKRHQKLMKRRNRRVKSRRKRLCQRRPKRRAKKQAQKKHLRKSQNKARTYTGSTTQTLENTGGKNCRLSGTGGYWKWKSQIK